ncbi:MAG: DUF4124 domain-containing protein [Halieaceae bacterium]|nr:DUF4124 domain-containing protein [Halieaceae bacterium]
MKPTNRNCCIAAGLVLLTLSGFPAQAGGKYYRWVDDTGTTVNSDRPPPAGVKYEAISGTPSFMYAEEEAESAPVPEDQPAPAAKPEVAKSQTRPMLEKNPEYCEQATKNLEVLNTKARIRVPDGNGNYRYIGEDEKAEQRTTAEAIIAQHCE